MFRRQFLIGVGATLVTAGLTESCGGSPTVPGGVTPPPQPPPEPPPPPPTPPPGLSIGRILAFGDSMTAGTTSPVVMFRALDAGLAQSYPFKLQTLLTSRYSAQTVEVFNSGKPAERATDGRNRLGGVLSEANASTRHPDGRRQRPEQSRRWIHQCQSGRRRHGRYGARGSRTRRPGDRRYDPTAAPRDAKHAAGRPRSQGTTTS